MTLGASALGYHSESVASATQGVVIMLESVGLADCENRASTPQSVVDSVAETLGRLGSHPLDTMIDLYVRATLAACSGNKSAAARALGITRWRLARLLAREAQ